jgi:hypothetical protein
MSNGAQILTQLPLEGRRIDGKRREIIGRINERLMPLSSQWKAPGWDQSSTRGKKGIFASNPIIRLNGGQRNGPPEAPPYRPNLLVTPGHRGAGLVANEKGATSDR